MTNDSLMRIKTMAEGEVAKLIQHMDNTEPDRHCLAMLKDLLKIAKLTHELMAMAMA